ncbi:MAG: HEAT repeat domain-containing protein [Nocardioides sp.]
MLPRDLDAPVGELVRELAEHVGEPTVVETCLALLRGADRADHLDALRFLAGRSFEPGDQALDPAVWKDYWLRTWGARGLLYVWEESAAAPPVIGGLADEHWRPAEMCLKVATRREVGGAGDGAVVLSRHELPRVRAQAMRTLGAVGDTEHVEAVRDALDDDAPDVRRAAARAFERLRARLDLEPRW